MESGFEEIREVRQRKKQTDPTCCPLCGVTIRPNEIDQHYHLELEKLQKISTNNKSGSGGGGGGGSGSGGGGGGSSRKPNGSSPSATASCSSAGTSTSLNNGITTPPGSSTSLKECWNTFQKIKNNRQTRLKIKTKKRKAEDPVCPICNERVPDDVNLHVELCLRKSEGNASDDSIDVEGSENESFEEYEWAGQSRIRVSSLLDGGYSATGIGTSISNTGQDDDEDLNVDGDDSQIYGPAQYTEHDLIFNPSRGTNKHRDNYLRKLVIGDQQPQQALNTDNNNLRDQHQSMDVDNNEIDWLPSISSTATAVHNVSPITCSNTLNNTSSGTIANNNNINLSNNLKDEHNIGSTNHNINNNNNNKNKQQDCNFQIIESLKERIQYLESDRVNKLKCLICLDEFRVPVVSICCWHVHCEECWLRTLGARKLCPQCNMITSPTDLRKIYM